MASVTEDGQKKPTSDSTKTTAPDIPGNLDLRLSTSIGRLNYDKYVLNNVSGLVSVKNKTADLSNLKMNLLEGQLVMNGRYNVTEIKHPKVDFDLDVAGFDIQKTCKMVNTAAKLAPIAEKCSGKFSTKVKFKADLDYYLNPELKTLTGGGNLSTKGVVVNNFEPLNKVADALKMDKFKKLSVNDINLTYEFNDGKVEVKPYDLKLGKTNVNISGFTGFDQSLDYTLKFQIPTSEMPSQATQVVNGLLAQANKTAGTNISLGENVNITALVGGTIKTPTVKTGLKDAAKNAVDDLKKKAEELAKQKLKEAEDKAREEGEKLKQKATDEATRLKNEAEQKAKAEADKVKAEAERKKKELEDKVKAEADKAKKDAEEKAKKEAAGKLKGLFGK
jgi:hypothetical protein